MAAAEQIGEELNGGSSGLIGNGFYQPKRRTNLIKVFSQQFFLSFLHFNVFNNLGMVIGLKLHGYWLKNIHEKINNLFAFKNILEIFEWIKLN